MTHAASTRPAPRCRLCGTELSTIFADLGSTPLANSYLRENYLSVPEPSFPLQAFRCEACGLAQLDVFVRPEAIFGTYEYFSSYSDSLLAHSRRFAQMMTARLGLSPGDRVIEVASNDGYLLQFFVEHGMEVLGIEPAANVAAAATARGIPTHVAFFGRATADHVAATGRRARLIVANNVIAHVPDLHDFASGFEPLLATGGVVSIECHHLLSLIQQRQFDTIYHEHLQYFSLGTLSRTLAAHGLRVFAAEQIPTQGGSLRVLASRAAEDGPPEEPSVAAVLEAERAAGLDRKDTYCQFGRQLAAARDAVLEFLRGARDAGRSVACYGAAAKGNTLLNYCGVTADQIAFCVDRNPHKQGLFLPGSRIPIYHPDTVRARRPDYLLILPWNIQDEIVSQMAYIREWGGQFVVPIPTLHVRA